MKASEKIKASVSLRELAERAGAVWDPMKTRKAAGDYWAPCPLHGEATPSFHVVEKGGRGGLFKCFGCGAGGSAIDFVAAIEGISPRDAIVRLVADNALGDLDPAREARLKAEREEKIAAAEIEAQRAAADGLTRARALWSGSDREACDVAVYLRARGANLSAIGGLPATLRGQADFPHWAADVFGAPQRVHTGAAMIGAIGRDRLVGVHQTWITPEGRARFDDGKKVPKKWRGETGAMFGQPCVLSRPSPHVVVGEGIETTLIAAYAKRGGKHDVARADGAFPRYLPRSLPSRSDRAGRRRKIDHCPRP